MKSRFFVVSSILIFCIFVCVFLLIYRPAKQLTEKVEAAQVNVGRVIFIPMIDSNGKQSLDKRVIYDYSMVDETYTLDNGTKISFKLVNDYTKTLNRNEKTDSCKRGDTTTSTPSIKGR